MSSKVRQRVRNVPRCARPGSRPPGDDFVAHLQGQVAGEHVEGLRVRRMYVQRRPRFARGEGHLDRAQSSVAVAFSQQDPQGCFGARPVNHSPSIGHSRLPQQGGHTAAVSLIVDPVTNKAWSEHSHTAATALSLVFSLSESPARSTDL